MSKYTKILLVLLFLVVFFPGVVTAVVEGILATLAIIIVTFCVLGLLGVCRSYFVTDSDSVVSVSYNW